MNEVTKLPFLSPFRADTHTHMRTYVKDCISTFMFIYIGNFRSNQAKRRVKALTQRHKNRMRKNRIFRVAPAKYATFIFNAPRHDEKNKKMRNSITASQQQEHIPRFMHIRHI